jgi:hypothetical protein
VLPRGVTERVTSLKTSMTTMTTMTTMMVEKRSERIKERWMK